MPVSPTGSISLSVERIAQFIESSPTFVAWVSPTVVTDHVYRVVQPTYQRPYALVGFGGAFAYTRDAQGAGVSAYETSGDPVVFFEAELKHLDGDTLDEKVIALTNKVGAIIDELLGNQADFPNLNIRQVVVGDPKLSARESSGKDGDYLQILVRFRLDGDSVGGPA